MSEEKEHKKNWREVYATVEEIKDFLRAHVFLRYNTVKHQVEVRLPSQDFFCCNEELEQFVTDDWQLMDNRLYKTLLSAHQTVKPTRERDFELVLGSGFVPGYHPFQYYLNRLPNDQERGDFYTATDILGKIPYNPAVHLTIEKVGSAMKALGFAQHRSNGRRGYRVVAYKPEEIEMNRHRLAYDATLEDDDDRVSRDT